MSASHRRAGGGRTPAALALIAALALAAFGIVKGTRAVGGSDSSCYGLMAEALASGHWQPTSAMAAAAPWPDAPRTLAPGGFIPSPVRADAASPICAPGMSVLMAPLAALLGRDAIFYLTPAAGFLLVWSGFVLGRRLAGGLAGAAAAILTAASPIVLFQVVQPMNDIVTAALWLSALAISSAELSGAATVARGKSRMAAAGLVTGLAILVRPNLAPLAVLVLAVGLQGTSRPWRKQGLAFVAGALPGVAGMLWLNYVLYGHVAASGYGPVRELFDTAHIAANLANYGRAARDTQTIFPALALLAPLVLTGQARRLAAWLLAFAAAVIAIYLLYRPYPEWWYLRFLIPGVVLALVLACAVCADVADRVRMRGVVAIGTVVLALIGLRTAGARQVLELQVLEGRYRETAALVRERLPENAVLITVWQSGSVKFHAGRDAVVWDALDPAWLDRAVAWIAGRGGKPYILIERREEAEFRARFDGHSDLAALDWPPRFELSRAVRIFDPDDRERYLAGELYPTEGFRPQRR
jgi:hypothetical protein